MSPEAVPDSDLPGIAGPAPASGQPIAVPDSDLPVDYGTPVEMLKTAGEQALSGATLGFSKALETKGFPALGIPAITTPEAIAGREAANPITSTLANIGGGAGLILGTGGLGGIAGEIGTAGKIGIGALEGAGFGGINQATDDWSQNKALDAQKIAASAGLGALIGGAGAGIVEGLRARFTPLAKVAPGVASQAEDVASTNPSNLAPGTPVDGGGVFQVADAPPQLKGAQPTSYQDIVDRVKDARFSGSAIELPQKAVLQDALSRIEMSNPVNPLQVDSLGNQTVRDTYNTFKETPGEAGEALQQNEALQKNELVGKAERTIKDISPGSEPVSDAVKGGQTAIDAFTNQYQNEQQALKPVFDNLKGLPYNGDLLGNTITRMVKAVPRVADVFDLTGGELDIKPYKTSMGIDESTYKAVKQAFESLQDQDVPDSFRKLWDIRKGLDQNIDVMAKGQAPAEIGAIKKSLMTQMEESSNNPTIRETFRRYAINEQQRQVIEKTFGASVGSPEFGAISKVKPEMIGDKIFGNTATVQAAKNILPKEQFNTILANWMSEARAAATDKGAFSSNKFGSFLRRNQDALNVAFSDNPAQLQRLRDLTTIMRILPDASPVNPSGTAKTLVRMISGMKLHDMTWEGLLASLPQKAVAAVEKRIQLGDLNKALAGETVKASATRSAQNGVAKTTSKLDSGIKELFSRAVISGAAGVARKMH
jgi:hypothetical protein